MNVNPATSMWVNVVGAIAGVLAAGGAAETTLFGQGPAQKIAAAAGLGVAIISGINAVLHAESSAQPGPLSTDNAKDARLRAVEAIPGVASINVSTADPELRAIAADRSRPKVSAGAVP